jgi:hypothetical protein
VDFQKQTNKKMKSECEKLTFGLMRNQAKQFRELQSDLTELIELSKLTRDAKMKAAISSPSNYYRHLSNKSFSAKQLIGMVKLIVEHDNLEIAKDKFRNTND